MRRRLPRRRRSTSASQERRRRPLRRRLRQRRPRRRPSLPKRADRIALSARALRLVTVVRRNATRVAMPLLAGLLACAALGASAQTWETGTDGLAPIPPLSARVTDLTHTLSAAETSALETKLSDWEMKTSNQLVVLIVPSTQPEPIEAYSIRVAEKWKIGRKGSDNGVLFLIAKNDRK